MLFLLIRKSRARERTTVGYKKDTPLKSGGTAWRKPTLLYFNERGKATCARNMAGYKIAVLPVPWQGIVTGVTAGECERQWTVVGMVMDEETEILDFSWDSAFPVLVNACANKIKDCQEFGSWNLNNSHHPSFMIILWFCIAFYLHSGDSSVGRWQANFLMSKTSRGRSLLPKRYPGICHYPCDSGQLHPSCHGSVFFFVVDQGFRGSRGWVEVS